MARRVIEKISRTRCPLRRSLMLFLAAVVLALSACNERNDAERPREQPLQVTRQPTMGGTYRRPLANDPSSLDPAKQVDLYAIAVAKQIFDGLVEFDSHLNVMPGLAQSWSASRDGLEWLFHLQQGVQFHSGREMSADDVVYSLSRLLDPTVGAHRSNVLDKVKGAADFSGWHNKQRQWDQGDRSLYRTDLPLRALSRLHQQPWHGGYLYRSPGGSPAHGCRLCHRARGYWPLSLRAVGSGARDRPRSQRALFSRPTSS